MSSPELQPNFPALVAEVHHPPQQSGHTQAIFLESLGIPYTLVNSLDVDATVVVIGGYRFRGPGGLNALDVAIATGGHLPTVE